MVNNKQLDFLPAEQIGELDATEHYPDCAFDFILFSFIKKKKIHQCTKARTNTESKENRKSTHSKDTITTKN